MNNELNEKFKEICRKMLVYADHINGEGYTGFPGYVPFAEELLALIEEHKEQKKEIIELFKTLWEKHQIDHDLIAICMHKLRWKELEEYFAEKRQLAVSKNDWNAISCIDDILEAYNDNWEDADDFYSELFKT